MGNISQACQKVNISRKTYYEWLKDDEVFAEDTKEAIKLGNQRQCDFAESAMNQQILAGNTALIIFTLVNRSAGKWINPQKMGGNKSPEQIEANAKLDQLQAIINDYSHR